MQYFYSFLSVQLISIYIVAGRSSATSDSDFHLGGYGKHTRTGFKGLRASVYQTFRLFIDSFPRQKKAKRPIREEYWDFQPINSSGEGEMTSLGT